MADRKHSQDITNANPLLTDLLLSLSGVPDNQNVPISDLKRVIQTSVQLDTVTPVSHSPGLLSYDPETKTVLADTGYSDVRVNIGQEVQIRFFNDTGVAIPNGTAINATGVDTTNNVVKGIPLDASNPATSSVFIGLATHDVPDQTVGVATYIGEVHGVNTVGFVEGGVLYAGTAGALTQDKQLYPSRIVIVGTVVKSDADGTIFVETQSFTRGVASKSYSFTQANVNAGIFYAGGFYNAPATSKTLNQATPSGNLGLNANSPHCSHAFIVCSGAGSVNVGQVGIRVTGNSINDQGVITPADSEILHDDIVSLSANQYLETVKKWVGNPTFELYIVSGVPTTYSLTFNWGIAKYEDLGNIDFTVTGFEVVGVAGANDVNFDMTLLKHDPTGWTYSAGSFVPQANVMIDWTDDLAPYDNLINTQEFSWKRDDLMEFIQGSSNEGLLVRIDCGENNSVQSMDIHIFGVIEDLIY